MYTASFLGILSYCVLYILSVFFAFYIPGSVLLQRSHIRTSLNIPLSIVVGMSLWALQGFILGYMALRWLTYGYLFIFLCVWLKQFFFKSLSISWSEFFHRLSANKLPVCIILLGTLIQLSTIWFTMIPTSKGLFYCCGDENDNTWFAAVTSELVRTMPPEQPGMAGVQLQNYHFLSNLVVAETSRVFHIPFLLVQYQFNTILLSVMFGLLAISFSKLLSLSKEYTVWLLFFLYFGSDAIYILLLFLGKGLNFSMSSLEDGVRFLANLPRAYSIILMFGFINLYIVWLKEKRILLSIVLGLIAGSLIGFKVYTGIFVIAGLFGLAFYELVKFKDIRTVVILSVTVIISLILYLPINAEAGGLYFIGLWRFENFIVQPALNLVGMEQARLIYQQHNNWIRVALNESIYIFFYMFSIFGSKLIGVFQTRKSVKSFPVTVHIILLTGIIVSLVAGLFFNQTIGTSNTFNFLVSVFIFTSFYSALTMAYALNNKLKIVKYSLVLCVIVITVPRILYETSRNINNLAKGNFIIVQNSALQASRYLESHSASGATILVDHHDFWYDVNAPMFAVLADRPMYLSGQGLLMHFGVNIQKRESIVKRILQSSSPKDVALALMGTNISYIVSSTMWPPVSTQSAIFMPIVYTSNDVTIRSIDYQLVKKTILTLDLKQ